MARAKTKPEDEGLHLVPRDGVWAVAGMIHGQRVRKSTGVGVRADINEAHAARAKIEYELFTGGKLQIGPKGLTYGQLCDEYMTRPEGVSHGTKGYIRRQREYIGDAIVDRMTAKDVQDYVKAKHYDKEGALNSLSGIRRDLGMMQAIMNWGVENEHILSRPKIVKPAEAPKRVVDSTFADLQAVLGVCVGKYAYMKPLLTFYAYTGARGVEAMELTWDQLKCVNGQHSITLMSKKGKGKVEKHRMSMLHPAVVAELNKTPENKREGRIFRNSYGQPWSIERGRRSTEQWSGVWGVIKDRAGVDPDLRVHDFRHIVATYLLSKKVDLITIQSMLGHADLNTTSIYIEEDHDRLAEAITLLPEAK